MTWERGAQTRPIMASIPDDALYPVFLLRWRGTRAEQLQLGEGAEFQVVLSRFTAKEALLKVLRTLGVANQFRQYSPDQLCTTSIDFAGRPR